MNQVHLFAHANRWDAYAFSILNILVGTLSSTAVGQAIKYVELRAAAIMQYHGGRPEMHKALGDLIRELGLEASDGTTLRVAAIRELYNWVVYDLNRPRMQLMVALDRLLAEVTEGENAVLREQLAMDEERADRIGQNGNGGEHYATGGHTGKPDLPAGGILFPGTYILEPGEQVVIPSDSKQDRPQTVRVAVLPEAARAYLLEYARALKDNGCTIVHDEVQYMRLAPGEELPMGAMVVPGSEEGVTEAFGFSQLRGAKPRMDGFEAINPREEQARRHKDWQLEQIGLLNRHPIPQAAHLQATNVELCINGETVNGSAIRREIELLVEGQIERARICE